MTSFAAMPTSSRPRSRQRNRSSNPWLGVDVGTCSVKLAVVGQNRFGEWELTRAVCVPWAQDADPFASPEALSESLEQVLQDTRSEWEIPKLRRAAFSLPGLALSYQELSVSSDDVEAVDSQAADAMTQLYGDRPENLAFDAWLPDSAGQSLQDDPQVNLVWADPDVVSRTLLAFKRCGLAAGVLDVAPFTTARAFELFDPMSVSGSELVVDWGASGLSLTWICDGRPRFHRTASHGAFTSALKIVSDALSLPFPECELLLSKYGLTDKLPNGYSAAVDACLAGPLDDLIDEIDQTLAYLSSRYARWPVQRCLLIGGGAAVRHLDGWLGQQTEFDVQVWSLPSPGNSSSKLLTPDPLFASAAALSALAYES